MAHCPKCNKEIDSLEAIAQGSILWDFSLDEDGDFQYTNMVLGDDTDGNTYLCPICNKELFIDEEKAAEFLGGGNAKKNE